MNEEKILNKLHELELEIKEIKNHIIVLMAQKEKQCTINESKLTFLEKKIKGNGEKGIIAELEDIKKEMVSIKIFNAKLIGAILVIQALIHFLK